MGRSVRQGTKKVSFNDVITIEPHSKTKTPKQERKEAYFLNLLAKSVLGEKEWTGCR